MQWRNLKHLIDPTEAPKGFSDAWILLKSKRAMSGLANLVLECSHIAQSRCGVGLADIMQDNYVKLQGRIDHNLPVTKTATH